MNLRYLSKKRPKLLKLISIFIIIFKGTIQVFFSFFIKSHTHHLNMKETLKISDRFNLVKKLGQGTFSKFTFFTK